MSTIESVLAQYEKNKQAASDNANRVSSEERLKKFFAPILPKGKQNDEKRIRILPTKDGSTPFVEVYFHEIQVDGKWVKLYDPAQDGKRSPLNEVRQALLDTGKEADKETAKMYRSRKFYIVKVIDRENEQDGVKFWRFKDNYKGEGILDKIFPIFKNKGDITDIQNGRDLIVSLSLSKSGNGRDYTTISSVFPDDPTPLHEDSKIADEWVSDALKWSDVYSKKGEDYLELVAMGEIPKWDTNLNKWVAGGSAEATIGGDTSDDVVDPQADEDPDDNLPF